MTEVNRYAMESDYGYIRKSAHRDLLVKFMAHVAQCEGHTYINDVSCVKFTEKERAELCKLSYEGDKKYHVPE